MSEHWLARADLDLCLEKTVWAKTLLDRHPTIYQQDINFLAMLREPGFEN